MKNETMILKLNGDFVVEMPKKTMNFRDSYQPLCIKNSKNPDIFTIVPRFIHEHFESIVDDIVESVQNNKVLEFLPTFREIIEKTIGVITPELEVDLQEICCHDLKFSFIEKISQLLLEIGKNLNALELEGHDISAYQDRLKTQYALIEKINMETLFFLWGKNSRKPHFENLYFLLKNVQKSAQQQVTVVEKNLKNILHLVERHLKNREKIEEIQERKKVAAEIREKKRLEKESNARINTLESRMEAPRMGITEPEKPSLFFVKTQKIRARVENLLEKSENEGLTPSQERELKTLEENVKKFEKKDERISENLAPEIFEMLKKIQNNL